MADPAQRAVFLEGHQRSCEGLFVRENFLNEYGAKLFVCSTPIGNLQDVSFRLLETLRTVDVVAAEDTRHTRKLLAKYEIHPGLLVSYHQHNRVARHADFIEWWEQGKTVAVLTDAGTPGISDPGDDVVAVALRQDVPVIPIPGPSAVLAAIVASGQPSQPFTFIGFLARDEKSLAGQLSPYAQVPGTLIMYEAPHRLSKTLRQIQRYLPNRTVVLAKELTKKHETFIEGEIDELLHYLEEHPARGEYVIVVGPRNAEEVEEDDVQSAKHMFADAVQAVRTLMAQGMSHTQAVKTIVEQTGVKKKDLYQQTLP